MSKTKHVISREYLYEQYVTKEKSFHQISQETGINQATLRYKAKSFGIPIRDRFQAQQLSQKSGRAYNPTAGKSLSPEHRESISKRTAEHWANKTDEEKEAHRLKCIEASKKDPDRLKRFRDAGKKAQKRISKEGSSIEGYLVEQLSLLGYWVEPHKKHAIQSEEMHIDIMLKKERIAIEVDGPTHLRPVYSQEDFEKKKEKDLRKNGLLLQDGYSVIRIGVERARSLAAKRAILDELIDVIEQIKQSPNTVIYCGKYN